jgi:prepilin-type N-terminal cleavage/methylation domain-containing protein
MKRFQLNYTASRGFTLIEVIATLIVAGILSAFFIHFMGTALDNSWKSVDMVASEAEAQGKLDEIIAYYTSKINANPDTALAVVKSEFSGDATMDYIEFDSAGNEITAATGASNNLKVTVAAPGNDLTTLLTKSRKDAGDPKVNY